MTCWVCHGEGIGHYLGTCSERCANRVRDIVDSHDIRGPKRKDVMRWRAKTRKSLRLAQQAVKGAREFLRNSAPVSSSGASGE